MSGREPEARQRRRGGKESVVSTSPVRPGGKLLSADEHVLHIRLDWRTLAAISMVLGATSMLLSFLVESFKSPTNHPIIGAAIAAGVLSFIATPVTHSGPGMLVDSEYTTFQPFVGGKRFVILQALGWSLYSCTLLGAFWVGYLFTQKLTPGTGLVSGVGVGGFLSQLLIMVSLWYFEKPTVKPPSMWEQLKAQGFYRTLNARMQDLMVFGFVASVFHLPIFICCLLIAILATPSAVVYVLFFLCFLPLYALTFRGRPHITGSRRWEFLCNQTGLFDAFVRYFQASIVLDSPEPLDPKKQYLFAFSPHGIYPVSCIWAPLCTPWKKIIGVKVAVMAASVVFYAPFIRDIALWLGCRDVARESIEHALGTGQSVVLVPGGQAEMQLQDSEHEAVRLVIRHKGFLKLALLHGVPVVPVFSFGESLILDNVHMPTVQQWFLKRVGFLFPLFPHGRFGLPIPRNSQPMTLVIGTPIEVHQTPDPTPKDIADLHAAYCTELRRIFTEYSVTCGFEHKRLELVTE